MKKLSNTIIYFYIFLFANVLSADSIDDALKSDFSKQETIKIRFEVNKRLFSYEAGKFKIENARKNRDKIRAITDRIVPWAIMEHMTPPEVARIIVYMYHADEAGAPYLDAEDLIPMVAQHDIPLKDFVLMVQYNRETKAAAIPDEIREAFLGYTFSKGWDGVSILAGGRGMILAKIFQLNINKTASLLVKRLPAKGGLNPAGLTAIIENIIGESIKEKNARELMNNLASAQKSFKQTENSPRGLKTILDGSSQSADAVKIAAGVRIPAQTVRNDAIDKESGVVAYSPSEIPRSDWQILKRNNLFSAIKPWLGTPYQLGNKTGRPGIDCSGFVRAVLVDKKVGVPSDAIGYCSAEMCKNGSAVGRNNMNSGDLVFFSASPDARKITHVGLVTSPGYFTHASTRGVVSDELGKKWWTQRYITSRRVFEQVTN
jgi:cell wall-associated NlpC family hydrolase